MTPEEIAYDLNSCEGKFQLWGIITGLISLVIFVHWAVVLKQNYMNRLPLSQAIAIATRNSRAESLTRRSSVSHGERQATDVDDMAAMLRVNLPQNYVGV